jgi:exopolyphosphatase/guanosine-5'-triphosphate,3'-diphosphate pyrophosphatase
MARDRRSELAATRQARAEPGPPVAVIDIGSNSVRLVVYEAIARSPTPIFNEKVLAGLGREVQSTGLLAKNAIEKALYALRRFRALCDVMGVARVWPIATAACREAANGPAFVAAARNICRANVDVLSGERESELSALGVLSGMHKPDGVLGDLGGGSIEFADIRSSRVKPGASLPLGPLALQDSSKKFLKTADKIVANALSGLPELRSVAGRDFYAVGGTWRALTRLHMWQTGYPLRVAHGYTIPAKEALEFARLVRRVPPETLSHVDVISEARRPLLPYAAIVLEHVLRVGKPRAVVVSALGVREGLLYSMLDEQEQGRDPLLAAGQELNLRRSRSPRHGEELVEWTDRFMSSSGIDESKDEKRLRRVACLLADTGWRSHPDYRGEQSLNLIANAAFVGVDHPGRAFLALAVFFRHVGLYDGELSPNVRELASARLIDRARVLGAAMRVAFLVSGAMPDVLPHAPMLVDRGKLKLKLRADYAALAGERLLKRLQQLARLIGREAAIVAD